MPKLIKGQPFLAQVAQGPIDGGRRATAEDMGGGIGAAVQGLGRQIGATAEGLLADQEAADQREALVSQAQIRQKYAKEIEDARISGADLEPIKQRLTDELETVRASRTTQRGIATAEVGNANTMNVFDSQVLQINVERASQEVRTKGAQFLSANGSILQSNPSYLPLAENDVKAFVGTFAHRLPPSQRAAIEQQLVEQLNVSAAAAAARMDPAGTRERLDKGEWTLSPEQRSQLVGMTDTQLRAKRADEDQQRVMAEHKRREASNEARDKYFKGIIQGNVNMREVMMDPDLTPQDREHMFTFQHQWSRRLLGEERRSDPRVVNDLYLKIYSDGPDRIYNDVPIMEELRAGRISVTDAEKLRTGVANQKDDNNRSFSVRLGQRLNVVGASMRTSPIYQAQPELAAGISLELQARAEQRAAALRHDGKDPSALLDPNSKDYFFTNDLIAGVAADVKGQARAVGGIAEPLAVGFRREVDGELWEFLGGEPGKPTSWRKVGKAPVDEGEPRPLASTLEPE